MTSNSTPGHPSRENHNSKRYMYPNVHCSRIHNSQDRAQPKCPSTEEWIKKMWYIYAMEYYSAVKKNEIMTFAAAWMDLESITVSEVRQRVRQWQTKVTCHHWCVEPKKRIQMNLFAEQKRVHRLWKTYRYQRGQVGRGRGGRGVWDGNVLKLGDDDGCTTINIIKIHWRTSHRGSLINEPNWYPWRWEFDPRPGSVG